MLLWTYDAMPASEDALMSLWSCDAMSCPRDMMNLCASALMRSSWYDFLRQCTCDLIRSLSQALMRYALVLVCAFTLLRSYVLMMSCSYALMLLRSYDIMLLCSNASCSMLLCSDVFMDCSALALLRPFGDVTHGAGLIGCQSHLTGRLASHV